MVNVAPYTCVENSEQVDRQIAFYTNVELIWKHSLMQAPVTRSDSDKRENQLLPISSKQGCLAILWAREAMNLDACVVMLAQQQGINSVKVSEDGPCFLMIDYDRDQISAQSIHQFTMRLGMDVRLVGC